MWLVESPPPSIPSLWSTMAVISQILDQSCLCLAELEELLAAGTGDLEALARADERERRARMGEEPDEEDEDGDEAMEEGVEEDKATVPEKKPSKGKSNQRGKRGNNGDDEEDDPMDLDEESSTSKVRILGGRWDPGLVKCDSRQRLIALLIGLI